MSFRFRLGPFAIGRTGLRLSIWRRRGGISTPLFGKNKQTFGIVRTGPFRWHFSKKLGARRSCHSVGNHGIPIRNGLYKCPQCKKYSAHKTNWLGRLRLKCMSCQTLSICRGVKNVGTLLHPNRRLYFQTITPTKTSPDHPLPDAVFQPSLLERSCSLMSLIVRVVVGLFLLLIILVVLLALLANS